MRNPHERKADRKERDRRLSTVRGGNPEEDRHAKIPQGKPYG